MPASDAPTRPLGTLGLGTGVYATWYDDALEQVPDLRYPESVTTYARMRHDPVLTGVTAGYQRPIVGAHWAVDPAGASDRAVRAVADSLGLPILGDDTQPGVDRNRRVQWVEHLRLATLALVFGHMGFEPVYRVDGTGASARALLAAYPERMPYSVSALHVDDGTGDFLGITQSKAGNVVGRVDDGRPEIPASRLVWHVNDREGSAHWGRSILRASFGPWLLKQEALRVHATSLRRFGAGTPVMEPLPGTNPTDAQVQAAARAARSVRVGDTGGAATPGFTLRIKGVEGTLPDALPFLRYLDEQMRVSVLESVLDLASSPNGSRALGDTFMDLLGMALQSVAEQVAATETEQLAARITDFTDGEGAAVPRIVVGDVTGDEQAVAAIVEPLVKSGAITPDPALEGFLRERYRLPAKVIDTAPTPAAPPAAPPAPVVPAVAAARGGTPKVGGRATLTDTGAWPYTRPLTAVEAAAGLDPQALDDANAAIAAAVLAAWPAIFKAQRDGLVAQVDDALTRGDVAALTALTVDTAAAEDTLANAVLDAAQAGVDTAVAEAATAGVTIDPAAVDVDTVALDTWARTVARSMGEGLAATAGAEASRLAGPASTASEVSAQVGAFLDGLSDVTVRDRVNGVIEGGMGSGRAATAKAAPASAGGPVFVHSAVRDSGTCEVCAAQDGHVYADQADMEANFPTGGYAHCLGRYRCRCVTFTQWPDA